LQSGFLAKKPFKFKKIAVKNSSTRKLHSVVRFVSKTLFKHVSMKVSHLPPSSSSKPSFSPLTPAQQQAIDPFASIWLTASAGSGKTKVLIDRLLALMLEGSSPQRLLCLTFTKAAAAEMANRLHQRLSDWAVMDQASLEASLRVFKKNPSLEDQTRARQLLTLFLDTPGGLKIQTLHSFCQFLLRQFPLEAAVNPSFSVLEERHAQELLATAQDRVLELAHQGAHPHLTEAVTHLASTLHENRLTLLLQEAFSKRLKLLKLFRQTEGDAFLRQSLDLSSSQTVETAWETFVIHSLKNLEGLQRFSTDFEQGKAKDQAFWHQAQRWCKTPSPSHYKAYRALFFTGTGTLRKQILSAALLKNSPGLESCLIQACEAIEAYELQRKSLGLYQNTQAFWVVLKEVQRIYEALKKQKAVLDYDDLILNTLALLKGKRGGSGWVLYKLDKGIDHILVDEAQDTSEEQWDVLRLLTEAFFSHPSQTEPQAPRTLFVVGDPKQSIYRFQGASPHSFFDMQRYFRDQVTSHQGRWFDLRLETSFRSSPAILEAVDRVFQIPQLKQGIYEDALSHQACSAKQHQEGRVEIWPAAPLPEKKEKQEPWELPLHPHQTLPAYVSLAKHLASTFAQWFHQGERRASGALLRPKDLLILVRRRTFFVDSLVRELKEKEIPVAGADRLFFADQLAIADLLKLGEFLLFTGDDLALATVLKGPFLGLTEEALFELAWDRGPQSLWERLTEKALTHPQVFQEAYAFLALLREEMHVFFSPYRFYQRLLTVHGGKRKILERLGPEAQDPLEEFLNLALAYERTHPASLQGFLAWLARADVNIKRDLEHHARDEVRIMTVHGSKGLQAPVVVLADTCQAPSSTPSPLLWGKHKARLLMLLAPPASEDISLSHALKEAERHLQEQEYHRLLYVAMTRAEERLYLAGWQQSQKTAFEQSWYPHLEQALTHHPATLPFPFQAKETEAWNGQGYRLQTGLSPAVEEAGPTQKSPPAPQVRPLTPPQVLPDWTRTAPPPEAMPVFLAPSLGGELGGETLRGETGISDVVDAERSEEGQALHRLLQLVKNLPPTERLSRVEKALQSHPLLRKRWAERLKQFDTLLNNPACDFLFTSQTQAEVPLTAWIEGKRFLGQIDYLWQAGEQIRIVDFKTGHHPPEAFSHVPSRYLQQLTAYAEGISQIYPGQEITCGLLWLQTGELQWLPKPLTDPKPFGMTSI
jgi:ATP-dependent helicase/nuclease subunit A